MNTEKLVKKVNKHENKDIPELREQLDNIVQENAKKLDYLTPKMFGAVCDGIKDDTEALREAIYILHILLGNFYFFQMDANV